MTRWSSRLGATFTYGLDTEPQELIIPFTGTWVLDPVPKNPAGGDPPGQRRASG